MTDSIEVLRALIPQCKDKKINQSRVMELAVYHIQGLEQTISEQRQYIEELEGKHPKSKRQKVVHTPSVPEENPALLKGEGSGQVSTDPIPVGSPSLSPRVEPMVVSSPPLRISEDSGFTSSTPAAEAPPENESEWGVQTTRDWTAFPSSTYEEFIPLTNTFEDAGMIFDSENIDIEDIAAYKWPFQPFQSNTQNNTHPNPGQHQHNQQLSWNAHHEYPQHTHTPHTIQQPQHLSQTQTQTQQQQLNNEMTNIISLLSNIAITAANTAAAAAAATSSVARLVSAQPSTLTSAQLGENTPSLEYVARQAADAAVHMNNIVVRLNERLYYAQSMPPERVYIRPEAPLYRTAPILDPTNECAPMNTPCTSNIIKTPPSTSSATNKVSKEKHRKGGLQPSTVLADIKASSEFIGYTFCDIIGQSANSIVFYALSPAKEKLAVKILRSRKYSESKLHSEVFFHSPLGIVPISQTKRVNSSLIGIEMPHMPKNLQTILKCGSDRVKAEGLAPVVIDFTKQIFTGLLSIHSHDIIHRDIQPSNILLSEGEKNIYICDFGDAMALDGSKDGSKTTGCLKGTPGYMAPEVVRDQEYDMDADCWSAGVITLALFEGDTTFANLDPIKAVEAILLNVAGDLLGWTPSGADFLKNILTENTTNRLSVTKALEHPFLVSQKEAEKWTLINT
eukprot:TRINITY_DN2483_c1_g1_i1.p1 TRINITY_DN2483_c1_g1~~TRINITY_DN2483_c1_g1_i1.p1  ORF type:complete len:746 (-),score=139.25 TRINITY_DN2483_c1_g1_i1:77-2110(-)